MEQRIRRLARKNVEMEADCEALLNDVGYIYIEYFSAEMTKPVNEQDKDLSLRIKELRISGENAMLEAG